MVIVIGAATMVMGLAASILGALFKIERGSRAAVTDATTVSRLARHFRADVHAATAVKPITPKPGGTVFEVIKADNESTTYRIKGSQLVRESVLRGEVRSRETYAIERIGPLAFGVEGKLRVVGSVTTRRGRHGCFPPRAPDRGFHRQRPSPRARGFHAKGRLMKIDRRPPRQGVALIPALVCLVLVGMLCALALRTTHTQRVVGIAEHRRLQAEWLAESGLARAAARLAADPSYKGETWDVPGAAPSAKLTARELSGSRSSRPKARRSACSCKLKPTTPAKIQPRGRVIENRSQLIFPTTDCSGVPS